MPNIAPGAACARADEPQQTRARRRPRRTTRLLAQATHARVCHALTHARRHCPTSNPTTPQPTATKRPEGKA
eukprot:829106-Alexandrium_andersonii.AAC.1